MKIDLFAIIEPKSGTQHYAILEYLRAGNRLTPLEALRLFGTMKLASRISELREMGHHFEQQLIKTDTGKWVMQYWMSEQMAWVGR